MKRILLTVILTGCTLISLYAQKSEEKIMLQIKQDEMLSADISKCMDDIAEMKNNEGERGLLSTALDFVTNISTRALFSALDGIKESRIHEWKVPVAKDYFYNSLSFLGPYDPTGMHFSGIKMTKESIGDGGTDGLFHLECSMPDDSVSLRNFLASSRFTMIIDTLAIDLSKVNAKYTASRRISIDINIEFKATWMDSNLTVHQDQNMGMFRISLPGMKYDPADPVKTFNAEEASRLISGSCFFIPRSYAAYVETVFENNTLKQEYRHYWSPGEFEVCITIRESTARKKGKHADYAYEYLQKALPGSLQNIATNENIVGSGVVNIIRKY